MKMDFISKRGDVLPLTENELFFLTNVDGQTAAVTSLSNSVIGGIDGDTVLNAQVQPRTLIFDLRFKSGVNIENAKREILKVVKVKQHGAIVWEQNDRTVTITGIVESIEMPRWNNAVVMQITLHCEQPFWEDIEAVIQQINEYVNLHYFVDSPEDMLYFPEEGIPFGAYDTTRTKTFSNQGDVSVGIQIEIIAVASVTNPIIYDTDGNFFGVGYGTGNKKVTMNSGDMIVITTHKGNKRVTLNGVNMLDKIKPQSTWLQMQTGDNQFAINSDDVDTGNMTFNLTYTQRYL